MDQSAKTKAYEAPKLVRYGDLVEVTRSIVGGSGRNDMATGPDKTA